MKVPQNTRRGPMSPQRDDRPPTKTEMLLYIAVIVAAFGFALLVMLKWGSS